MSVPPTAANRARRPDWRVAAARVALIVGFAWLVGRFWHPHYGFTRFVQMDRTSLAATVPELRSAPIYTYDGGYDGDYYAQLAARPMADDPALAIDNIVYRGRRILLSWTAWTAAGGDSVAAVRVYAWLNLAIWAILAGLLWRILPVADWRSTAAWAGVLFSAGALHSVRLALTDLLAMLFVAAAVWSAERGLRGPAAALLGIGGLARETTLLGAVALLPSARFAWKEWLRVAGWGALAALPLAAWLWHLRSVHGLVEPGLSNLTLPVMGWAGRWGELLRDVRVPPDRWLVVTALLAHIAFTVQFIYFAMHRDWKDSWWRTGVAWSGLMLLIGTAVWEGYPGAAARVLLPLGLAFNVFAARKRASFAWFALGNLSVFSGVLALWTVPADQHELAAGRGAHGSYVVHTDDLWYGVEANRSRAWAWCARAGTLEIDCWPRTNFTAPLGVQLKGFAARPIEIVQDGHVIWSGEIGVQRQEIVVPSIIVAGGRTRLEVRSSAPPGPEPGDGGRELGFAVYDVRVD